VNGLIRSLGEGLKKENIKVNGILPGAVPTNIGLPVKFQKLGIKPTLSDDKITKEEHILAAITDRLGGPAAFGQCVDVSDAKCYYRKQHEYCKGVRTSVQYFGLYKGL
jgi:15-hydroxyprostaglandin dehydrogenase (NAD)